MRESILVSVKKMLGITDEYKHFDVDLIMHINTAFMVLNQLGVGPDGFSISDDTTTWAEYLPDIAKLEAVRTYVYLKVKLIFDPPLNSTVTACYEKTISELEYRLSVAAKKTQE